MHASYGTRLLYIEPKILVPSMSFRSTNMLTEQRRVSRYGPGT
jgi:hypothetical protein